MKVDADIYDLFSKAIYHTLKKETEGISYTNIVSGVKKCFKDMKTTFNGSIEWYTVTVKLDMEATGLIESFIEKGKKVHRLKR
jgi:hypothetical protein